ncbi:hypothetical protein [Halosolutus gelatinilyticus]|uniref:hypothetical protein n=1 Tax=Halosolutus gelatinilyticus TaxID=2931975 RepID=UPI001FF43616|nr:hypothetical protein [Halosolutus gelatinilyticus]
MIEQRPRVRWLVVPEQQPADRILRVAVSPRRKRRIEQCVDRFGERPVDDVGPGCRLVALVSCERQAEAILAVGDDQDTESFEFRLVVVDRLFRDGGPIGGVALRERFVGRQQYRDARVVKAIVADGRERLTLSDLHELYRGHTDVRSKETLKEHTKTLTATDLFEIKNRALLRPSECVRNVVLNTKRECRMNRG